MKTRRKPHTSLRWLSYAERRRTSISPDRWAGTSPRYTDDTQKYVKGQDIERQHGGVWIQSYEHEHGVRAMRRAGRDDEEVAYCY